MTSTADTDVIAEALAVIDRALGAMSHRELVSTGEVPEALEALDRATRLYRSFARAAASSGRRWIPSSLYAVDACYGDAYVARDGDGDLYRAYRHYARAIAIVEQLRERAATSTDLKASYFSRLSWIYDRMVELLLEMKRRNLPLRRELLQLIQAVRLLHFRSVTHAVPA